MLKEAAEKKLRAWLNAPFEEIQRDLDSLAAVVDLTTDELNQLIAIGTVMADQKRVEAPSPKPKRGRPVGTKTRKETFDGNVA